MPPIYSYDVERGRAGLRAHEERRLRRVIDRGNRGNMLSAAVFASADGPRRWGLANGATVQLTAR